MLEIIKAAGPYVGLAGLVLALFSFIVNRRSAYRKDIPELTLSLSVDSGFALERTMGGLRPPLATFFLPVLTLEVKNRTDIDAADCNVCVTVRRGFRSRRHYCDIGELRSIAGRKSITVRVRDRLPKIFAELSGDLLSHVAPSMSPYASVLRGNGAVLLDALVLKRPPQSPLFAVSVRLDYRPPIAQFRALRTTQSVLCYAVATETGVKPEGAVHWMSRPTTGLGRFLVFQWTRSAGSERDYVTPRHRS